MHREKVSYDAIINAKNYFMIIIFLNTNHYLVYLKKIYSDRHREIFILLIIRYGSRNFKNY